MILSPHTLREMRALQPGDVVLVAINGRQAPRLRTALATAARAHRDAGHDFDWILTEAPGWIVLERVPHDMPARDRAARVLHWRTLHHRRDVRAEADRLAA